MAVLPALNSSFRALFFFMDSERSFICFSSAAFCSAHIPRFCSSVSFPLSAACWAAACCFRLSGVEIDCGRVAVLDLTPVHRVDNLAVDLAAIL